MKRARLLTGLAWGVASVGLLLAAGRARGGITSGQLLTNFASATFNLPGGANVKGEEQPGMNPVNWPNAATAWVLITDQPTLCLAIRKTAIDCVTAAPITGAYPGASLCFQISFSNCGNFSGWSVLFTDVLPTNVTKQNGPVGPIWAATGGHPPSGVTPSWASTLLGPWYSTSNLGQVSPMYMRWLMTRIGMHKTGYIRYQVLIN